MYSETRIVARAAQLLASPAMRARFPGGFPHYSLDDTRALTAQIAQVQAEDGSFRRRFSEEEERFLSAAKLRVIYDAPYFLSGFVWIDEEAHGLRPLYPLWESQTLLLQKLADLEDAHLASSAPDGLLVNVLKVRQVGISTAGVALAAHRTLTQPYIRALLGSDVERQAGYLFQMAQRIYEHLPFFLRPGRSAFNKDREIQFSNASSIRTAWGKSTRGALQEVGGTKGNIERGRTNSVVHISELATWDNPEQLDTALMAGIPISPSVLCIFESTAEIAGDWWNRHWDAAKKGTSRFTNLFLPWYSTPSKYSLQPPLHWVVKPTTLAMAQKVIAESPQWLGGRTLRPTAAQLYWYEQTRGYFEEKGNLAGFLREYPSDDEECFQYAGGTVFSPEQIARIDRQARPTLDIWTVQPARDIAKLQAEDRKAEASLQGSLSGSRPTPPLTMKPGRADPFPVPAGYGFRRLPPAEIAARIAASDEVHQRYDGLLTIFEYPRSRGPRRYVLACDIGDGLKKDYSVLTVVRLATVEEVSEEVAQFLSNTLDTKQIAFIADALGRLYPDEDGIEACAAIETNNHGLAVQDLLQIHLGYSNFYVWEYYNAASPDQRYSRRIGWSTTVSTRPLLLSAFHAAVTSLDPLTERPDYRLNSAVTRQELRHFITATTLAEAEHAPQQHDDAIFSSAIGYYVGYRLSGVETEPIAERRHRRSALAAYHAAQSGKEAYDWRNSDATADDQRLGIDEEELDAGLTDRDASLYFDERATDD